MTSQRFGITVLVFWVIAILAYLSARGRAESPRYEADFRIAIESGYSATKDGVQFIALQRIDSKEIDRAVLSIDADLPLAKHLAKVAGSRVRITVEAVDAPELQRLVR